MVCRQASALALLLSACAGRRTAAFTEEDMQVYPSRKPTAREAADSGVKDIAAAARMPWFPTHATVCDGRPCRPGEGNIKGYRMWGQPYIHRESFVQSRSRRPPHPPEPLQYANLVSVARCAAISNSPCLHPRRRRPRQIARGRVLHLAHRLTMQATVRQASAEGRTRHDGRW